MEPPETPAEVELQLRLGKLVKACLSAPAGQRSSEYFRIIY
jgi:hypothetical protein